MPAVGVYLLQRYWVGRRSYVTVTGKGFRPRPIDLGRLSALTFSLATLYVILAIAAPVLVLCAATLSPYTWAGQYSFDNLRAAPSALA